MKRVVKNSQGLVKKLLHFGYNYFGIFFHDLFKFFKLLGRPHMRKIVWNNIKSFVHIFYKRITTEGIIKEASALTYITMLSFIPFLMFLFFIIPDLPFLNLQEKISELVSKNFIPDSAVHVNQFVQDTLSRRSTFNILNFIILTFTSYALFKVIRDTFDRILSLDYRPKQDMVMQIIKFLGTIIFGMVIILMLFSSSSLPVISAILDLPILRKYLVQLIPFITQFLALVFLYMILPSIRIKRSALMRGAFWTTVIWVMAKAGFDFYIFQLTNIEAVYGVLASLPIFLMWIYINWVIILGGIVLVSVLDQKDKVSLTEEIPKSIVKLTLELYSDKKLNDKLEQFVKKQDLKELIKCIDEKEEP
ncbi:MAG: YihY/virulence factor BrkB family protein [Candidatus Cloacimonetes bacterium]|nr:YihY/virulence factor BrkB family protein [Candidatus Cloacimonadota bacterium]